MKKLLLCTALMSLWGMSAEALKFENDSTIYIQFIVRAEGEEVITLNSKRVEGGGHYEISSEELLKSINEHNVKEDTEIKIMAHYGAVPQECKPLKGQKIEAKDVEKLAHVTVEYRLSKEKRPWHVQGNCTIKGFTP